MIMILFAFHTSSVCVLVNEPRHSIAVCIIAPLIAVIKQNFLPLVYFLPPLPQTRRITTLINVIIPNIKVEINKSPEEESVAPTGTASATEASDPPAPSSSPSLPAAVGKNKS
jgi:hypothetical protein